MNPREQGVKIEKQMMKMFKGYEHYHDAIDFETKNCIFDVKSCNLFNHYYNHDHLKPYKFKVHKNMKTHHLGRFHFLTDNHILLYLMSLKLDKIPKYLFVVKIGKQNVFKTLAWDEVVIPNSKDNHAISVAKIFK